jgi:fido (protein-threonine AMPylation protein)
VADFHARFEKIHPFYGGNGRAGRLLALAYIMAKHADPDNVPSSLDDWLEQFNTFSIYGILPQLIEL